MSAALPPVTDCGCSSSPAISPTPPPTTGCCFLEGVDNPNHAGVVPPNTTIRYAYYQLQDFIDGPVAQIWYWNPYLSLWQ